MEVGVGPKTLLKGISSETRRNKVAEPKIGLLNQCSMLVCTFETMGGGNLHIAKYVERK
jgi:hypothetical protein